MDPKLHWWLPPVFNRWGKVFAEKKEVCGGLNIGSLLHIAAADPGGTGGCYPFHGVLGLDRLAALNIFIDRGGKVCHITSTCVIVVCHIESMDCRF
jgi:hypothetical protein